MVIVQAPAKINIHLDIRHTRPDGYHELVSLFQSVSLSDTLVIRSLKTKHECRIADNSDIPCRENIVSKTYERFVKLTGITTGVDVELHKSIPIGGGLGGGSSDAAAMISGLQLLAGTELTESEDRDCALSLGSDVHYFRRGAAAIVTGRGENVMPLVPRTDFSIVIIRPDFSISTKDAYTWLDGYRAGQSESVSGFTAGTIADVYGYQPISNWKFNNSFTPVLVDRHPAYKKIFAKLQNYGSVVTNISGSGSCVFGIFVDSVKARIAFEKFMSEYPVVFCTKPLDKVPQPVLQ
jgi:4-diphosphocytidyl-2-C-methyl-D-erythritol kinase